MQILAVLGLLRSYAQCIDLTARPASRGATDLLRRILRLPRWPGCGLFWASFSSAFFLYFFVFLCSARRPCSCQHQQNIHVPVVLGLLGVPGVLGVVVAIVISVVQEIVVCKH